MVCSQAWTFVRNTTLDHSREDKHFQSSRARLSRPFSLVSTYAVWVVDIQT